MESNKRTQKHSILMTPLLYIPLIFTINVAIGCLADRYALGPLSLSLILGALNSTALFYYSYKAKKGSSHRGSSKHIGNMANYIYETVTQLESEVKFLKRGSSEFQKSLQGVTKAIEEIAAGSLSLVSDTEKIANHIELLEQTIEDNYEHIRRVTDNMDSIIDNKNRGLKLMGELRNHTKTTSYNIFGKSKLLNFQISTDLDN